MVYIDESKLAAYRNTIRNHKRELKFQDAHEASISRTPARPPEAPFEIDDEIFNDPHKDCKENPCLDCRSDDRPLDEERDTAFKNELYQDSFDLTDMDHEEL